MRGGGQKEGKYKKSDIGEKKLAEGKKPFSFGCTEIHTRYYKIQEIEMLSGLVEL